MSIDNPNPTAFDLRNEYGEQYVFCERCNARLWSEDVAPYTVKDRVIPCPYKGSLRGDEYGCDD